MILNRGIGDSAIMTQEESLEGVRLSDGIGIVQPFTLAVNCNHRRR